MLSKRQTPWRRRVPFLTGVVRHTGGVRGCAPSWRREVFHVYGSRIVWEGAVKNGHGEPARYRVFWHGSRILAAAVSGKRLKLRQMFTVEKRLVDASGKPSWIATGSSPSAVTAAMALELAQLQEC